MSAATESAHLLGIGRCPGCTRRHDACDCDPSGRMVCPDCGREPHDIEDADSWSTAGGCAGTTYCPACYERRVDPRREPTDAEVMALFHDDCSAFLDVEAEADHGVEPAERVRQCMTEPQRAMVRDARLTPSQWSDLNG